MWKNKTTPNFHQLKIPSPQENTLGSCTNFRHQIDYSKEISFHLTKPMRSSCQSSVKQSEISQKDKQKMRNRNRKMVDESIANRLARNCSQLSSQSKQSSIKIKESQQNKELRANLLNAEKIISELHEMVQTFQTKMLHLLHSKQQYTSAIQRIYNLSPRKPATCTQQQVWKNNYSELIEHLDNYTKNVTLLTMHHQSLEMKTERYRKQSKNAKKSQKNLVKVLNKSQRKLEKSEEIIQRLLGDVKERDNKIEEYQIENKNSNMKIIEQRDQLIKYQKQIKYDRINEITYKETIKNYKLQLQKSNNNCKVYQQRLSNMQKTMDIYKSTEKKVMQKVSYFQQQLQKNKKNYDKLREQKQKLCDKIFQQQKLLQLNKQIQNHLQKQKQISKNILLEKQKLLQFVKQLQKKLQQQSLIIKQYQEEIHKCKDGYLAMQYNLLSKIQQKQQYIEHLQQIKLSTEEQNDEVRKMLNATLKQLKNKQRGIIQKIKQPLHKSTNTQNNIKNKQKQSEISRIQVLQGKCQRYRDDGDGDGGGNDQLYYLEHDEGIIWKQLKKSSAIEQQNTIFEESNSGNNNKIATFSQVSEIQPSISSVECQTRKRKQNISKFLKNNQNQPRQSQQSSKSKIDNTDRSLINLPVLQIEQNIRNNKKINKQPQTPQNRFNLQAFQNKMIIEENAKVFLKFNKVALR